MPEGTIPAWRLAAGVLIFMMLEGAGDWILKRGRDLRRDIVESKVLEIRDRATFLPVLAARMSPARNYTREQGYLLRRCGYASSGPHSVLLTRLQGGGKAENDPYSWSDRTMQAAHQYIETNWDHLSDGDVVDVEFILGEAKVAKQSERVGG